MCLNDEEIGKLIMMFIYTCQPKYGPRGTHMPNLITKLNNLIFSSQHAQNRNNTHQTNTKLIFNPIFIKKYDM